MGVQEDDRRVSDGLGYAGAFGGERGISQPLGEQRYLLSPQDLAAVDLVPELVAAGVHSLKIEGRLKSPEYVAATPRILKPGETGYLKLIERAAPDGLLLRNLAALEKLGVTEGTLR